MNVDIAPFQNSLNGMKNIIYANTRFKVSWGGWTQVLYQKELLKTALSTHLDFNRIFIISGQDYPIKSNKYIKKELEHNPDRIYMKAIDYSEPTISKNNQQDYRLYHFFRDSPINNYFVKHALIYVSRNILKLLPIRKKRLPNIYGYQTHIYKSSGYMGLTLECARYVLKELESNKSLIRFFKYSFVPEEFVIPTIIFNSRYKQYAQLIKGNYEGLKYLSGLTYFNYGREIQVFKNKDYEELKSTDLFFVRKFQTGISDLLMDRLDKE